MKRVLISLILLLFAGISFLFAMQKPNDKQLKLYTHSSTLSTVKTVNEDATRIDYVDSEGNIVYASDKEYASIVIRQTEDASTEMYLDEFGEPTEKTNGNYAMYREYDAQGRNFRITYLGKDLQPMENAIGYAINERTFDERGKISSERYYDADGRPAKTTYGAYGRDLGYEEQCETSTYVGADDTPVVTKTGYATVKKYYLPGSDLVDHEEYFDLDEIHAKLSLGQYGTAYQYDEYGRVSYVTYLDAKGNPITTTEGFCSIEKIYDAYGEVELERYYDVNGKRVGLSHGQYAIKHIGNETVYLDSNDKEIFDLSNYLHNHPALAYFIAILVCVVAMLADKKFNVILLVLYVAFIVYMTLLYRAEGEGRAQLEIFWSYKQFMSSAAFRLEIINNIWLFVPLGAILYRIANRVYALIIPVVISVHLEILQYMTGYGLAEIDDLISNSLGGILGFGFAYAMKAMSAWKKAIAIPEKLLLLLMG